jgi:hypothetical protein
MDDIIRDVMIDDARKLKAGNSTSERSTCPATAKNVINPVTQTSLCLSRAAFHQRSFLFLPRRTASYVKAVNEEFASTNFDALCEKDALKMSGKKKKVQCFYKSADENESKKSAVFDESVMVGLVQVEFSLPVT